MDVLAQVHIQLTAPGIQSTPGSARPVRHDEVVGQLRHESQQSPQVIVILHHPGDRATQGRTNAIEHGWKQDSLLLVLMVFEIIEHIGKQVGQPVRAVGPVAVNRLDAAGQSDDLGEFAPVHLVIALNNVGDQVGRLGGRVDPRRLQSVELRLKRRQIEASALRFLGEQDVAPATKVDLVAPKDRRGSRQDDSDLADGKMFKCHVPEGSSSFRAPMRERDDRAFVSRRSGSRLDVSQASH